MCNSCGTNFCGGCGCNRCGNSCGCGNRWSRDFRIGYERGFRAGFNAANSGCGSCGCGTCRTAYSNDCGACSAEAVVPIMERDNSCGC